MTAMALPHSRSHLESLLVQTEQLNEWAERLHHYKETPSQLVITHTRDRRSAAESLAGAFSSPAIGLTGLHRLETGLERGDLVIVLASPASTFHTAPCLADGPIGALHRLVRGGVEIWGVTGPRPNSIADHCHDSIAMPQADLGLLLKSHELIVDRLRRPLAPGLSSTTPEAGTEGLGTRRTP